MKEIFKYINKSMMAITIIYNSAIYMCWYLYAISCYYFISGDINDKKIFLLSMILLILYIVRLYLKNSYRNTAKTTFYNIKHEVELYYFNKLYNLDNKKIEEVGTEKFKTMILGIAYNITKTISDFGEYTIPIIIGLLIFFSVLFKINIIVGIIIFILVLLFIINRYNSLKNISLERTNYNDLLADYILKIDTIKKMNCYNYCLKKLNSTNEENDIVILKNNTVISDKKFNNFIILLLILIFASVMIFVSVTINKLGTLLFFVIMVYKLKTSLYELHIVINNFVNTIKNKYELDIIFANSSVHKYISDFSNIVIKDEKVTNEGNYLIVKNFVIKKDKIHCITGSNYQGNILLDAIRDNKVKMEIDEEKSDLYIDNIYINENNKIFKDTLRDNLCLSVRTDDSFLIELINAVGLSDWFNSLKSGLDTTLDDEIDSLIVRKINVIRLIVSDKHLKFFSEDLNYFSTEEVKNIVSLFKKYMNDTAAIVIVTTKTSLSNISKYKYTVKNNELVEK